MRLQITLSVLLVFIVGCASAPVEAAQHRPGQMGPKSGQGQGMGMGMGMGPGMMGHGMQMGGCGMMGQGMKGMGLMGMVHGIMANADELKLTDEQIGKLHRVMWDMKKQKMADDGQQDVHAAKMELHTAMQNPSATEDAIRKAAKKFSESFDEHIDQMLSMRKQVLDVLTDKQKKQLEGMADQFKQPHSGQ